MHVVECCTSEVENAEVFNPYQKDYGSKNYLTASYLIEQFSADDYNCKGADVKTILNFDYPIIINGLFYINEPLAFVDCDNIFFGPKAKVIIEPNGRLFIRSSSLSACGDEMWQGIETIGNLDQKSGLEISKSCVQGTRPVIEDAERAIYLSENKILMADCILHR